MAVLPSQSAHCLPVVHQQLMNESAELASMYPLKFRQDLNGKQWAWQAVVILPFIDQSKLLKEVSRLEPSLSAAESSQAREGSDIVLVHPAHRIGGRVATLDRDVSMACDTGLAGVLRPSPLADHLQGVLRAEYQMPPWRRHAARLLPGAVTPAAVLTNRDLSELQRVIGGRGRLRLQTKAKASKVDPPQTWGSWSASAGGQDSVASVPKAATKPETKAPTATTATRKRPAPGSKPLASAVRKARYR